MYIYRIYLKDILVLVKYIVSVFRNAFFGDLKNLDGEVVKITLKSGDSLFLPSSCPHFVYTPIDTVAFGVNFVCGPTLKEVAVAYALEVIKLSPVISHCSLNLL